MVSSNEGFLLEKVAASVIGESDQSSKLVMKAGRHRLQKVLHELQDFNRTIWLGRNDALHQDKETAEAAVYSAESAEIRHYHSSPKLLPASDAHYCTNTTLDRIIRSRPSSVRRRWLRQIRTARANFMKDGNLQQSITAYLQQSERVHDSATALTTPISKMRNIRSTTTQQRMTSFFPGRPPDLQKTNLPGILRSLIEVADVGYLVWSWERSHKMLTYIIRFFNLAPLVNEHLVKIGSYWSWWSVHVVLYRTGDLILHPGFHISSLLVSLLLQFATLVFNLLLE